MSMCTRTARQHVTHISSSVALRSAACHHFFSTSHPQTLSYITPKSGGSVKGENAPHPLLHTVAGRRSVDSPVIPDSPSIPVQWLMESGTARFPSNTAYVGSRAALMLTCAFTTTLAQLDQENNWKVAAGNFLSRILSYYPKVQVCGLCSCQP